MINFLIKHCIKDYQKTQLPQVRSSYGKLSSIVGFITNILIATFKLLIGFITKSISIISDGFNNLQDSLSSIITLIGFSLSNKPADKEHPYGHARIEYIAGLITSILIIVLGIELIKESIQKIIKPENTEFSIYTVIILGGSILIKIWQGFFYKKTAKAINSTSLKANMVDSFTDVITSSVILAGLFITKFTGFNLDGFLGLAVSILIIINGIQLIKETSSPLLGTSAPEELIQKITNIINSEKNIFGFHDLRVHNYGLQNYIASVHLELDIKSSAQDCHKIADKIERKVQDELNVELTTHVDLVSPNDKESKLLKEKILFFVQGISNQITIHDFSLIHSNPPEISFDLSVPYNFYIKDEQLKQIVERGVLAIQENSKIRIQLDHE